MWPPKDANTISSRGYIAWLKHMWHMGLFDQITNSPIETQVDDSDEDIFRTREMKPVGDDQNNHSVEN